MFSIGLAVVVLAALAAAVPEQRDRDRPPVRSVGGQVTDGGNAPLADSIVYIKNLNNRAVKTFIATKEGTYEFHGLSPNVDYELFAEFQGQRSQTRVLSAFDSRPRSTINLRIDVNR